MTRRPQLLAELRGLKQKPQESVVVDYGERTYELLRLEDLKLDSAEMLLKDAFLQGLRANLQTPVVPAVTPKVGEGFEKVLVWPPEDVCVRATGIDVYTSGTMSEVRKGYQRSPATARSKQRVFP